MLLVLREMWAPGWRATVSGERRPVLQVNGLFRAVAVPAGTSEVTMTYRPAGAIRLMVGAISILILYLAGLGWVKQYQTTKAPRHQEMH